MPLVLGARRRACIGLAAAMLAGCGSSGGGADADADVAARPDAAAAPDDECDALTGGGGDASSNGDLAAPGVLVWRMVEGTPLATVNPGGLWGSGPDDLYVMTSGDDILHRGAAGHWTRRPVGGQRQGPMSIWGSGPTDVFVGRAWEGGLFHACHDDLWTAVTLPAAKASIGALWGSSAADVYAVGGPAGSPIFHLRNGAWTAESLSPGDGVLVGVWGSGPADVYALGYAGGALWRSRGDGEWRSEDTRSTYLASAIWGSGPSDVYIAHPGDGKKQPSDLIHSTGQGDWTAELTLEARDHLFLLWGSGPTDVFVAGWRLDDQGQQEAILLHSRGDGHWSPVSGPLLALITGLWGAGPGDVYLVGYLPRHDAALFHGTAN